MLQTTPNILLAVCPPGATDAPPLGLAYLATILRRTGIAVQICDINHRLYVTSNLTQRDLWQPERQQLWQNPEEVEKLIQQWKGPIDCILNEILLAHAPVLGFSVIYPNEIFTQHILKALKKRAPERRIILGGPGCNSIEQRQLLVEYLPNIIDFFVIGAGEQALTQALKVFDSGESHKAVQGLARANGKLSKQHPSPIPDLETLAYPTFEEFDLAAYSLQSLPLIWSRGCVPQDLYYKENSMRGAYQMRPVSSVLDELYYHVKRYGIRNFVVHDACVNGRPRRLKSICDAIIHSPLDITWSATAMPLPSLTRRLLRRMRFAGCHTLTFRIEIGFAHVSEQAAKTNPLKTTERVLKHAQREGIKVAVNIAIGFSSENENDFDAILEFLHRNQKWINRLENVSIPQVASHTTFHRQVSNLDLELSGKNIHDGNIVHGFQKRLRSAIELKPEIGFELGTPATYQPPDKAPLHYSLNPAYGGRQFYRYIADHSMGRWHGGGEIFKKKLKRILGNRGIVSEAAPYEVDVFKGISDGSRSFVGPQIVHLDLTNRCNLDCIACWYRSPMLTGEAITDDLLKKTLSFGIITDLIDDLVQMGGVRQIKLGGGGEPTMHPRFKDILADIKSRYWNIELEVNTNFTLVDEKLLNFMAEIGVDRITVSLWAGTPSVYVQTHPSQREQKFESIVSCLKRAIRIRKNGKPRISIHNVLMNLNYRDVEAMLELAIDIGADEISYALVDPIPGKTEHLLLNREECLSLRNRLKKLGTRLDKFEKYIDPARGKSIQVANYFNLLRRLDQSYEDRGSYDKKAVERMPCYIGWIFTRIMAEGKVVPCCKGHRLAMGELQRQRFKNIWHSQKYTQFRKNALKLKKSNPYFEVMGNDFTKQTGCYNCDNLIHNLVTHRKILSRSGLFKWVKFESSRLIGKGL